MLKRIDSLKCPAKIVLEDGFCLEGYSLGKKGTIGGEICFNTGMTGYQEIYTDPSYYGQVIVNTAPHIGNYGIHSGEDESSNVMINGLVVNDFSVTYSRFTAKGGLHQYLINKNIVGISGIDTRKLVRYIRNKGVMNTIISTEEFNNAELHSKISKIPTMKSQELSSIVTTPVRYKQNEKGKYKIAVLDLGIKKSILKNLESRDCSIEVFPARSIAKDLFDIYPAGIFLSNGPGDPSVMDYAVDTVKSILKMRIPLFGICLGHQIIARALGIGTYKMHHGHRGLNHPVKNMDKNTCEITSQNHGFSVNSDDLEKSDLATLTHSNLNDYSVEGLKINNYPGFSVQYHPESSPGPHDSTYLFDDFIDLIKYN